MTYDNFQTAYELWTMLESIYTAIEVQAIHNLRQQLDSLLYNDNDD